MCCPNLLKVLGGGISAGQSCPPEHLQQRHCLLQDLPQSLGVGQQTIHKSIVQDLHTGLNYILVLSLFVSIICIFVSWLFQSHQFTALFLVALQQRWAEAGLKGCLHVLDEAPALQNLLLQSTEIIHMTDGVAAIAVSKRSVWGLPLQLRVRVQQVCWGSKSWDVL